MSVHRLPDGSTVFLCGRNTGKTLSAEERLKRMVVEQAAKQGKCPTCLSPLADNCGHDTKAGCQRQPLPLVQVYAILNGMVAG